MAQKMKKKLKILFLMEFFSFLGGTEYGNYNLISGLKALGHDIKVCVGERLSYDIWAKMIRALDIELFVSSKPYDTTESLERDTQFADSVVVPLIKSWRPDLIYSHPPGKLLIALMNKCPDLDIPIAALEYTVPDKNTKDWHHPGLLAVQQRISAYIAKCGEAERGIRDYFGYKGPIYRLPNLIAKVPEGADVLTGELLSVGCIGRLSPEKGIGFLLGAWKEVAAKVPSATLHFYGHGMYEDYYKKLAEALGIGDSVYFEGTFQPISGLDSVAKKHKIFVQPSLFESMPNSLIELLLRKKALIATEAGGIPELIHPEKGEGILVKAGSTDDLSDAILRLVQNESLADSMASKSQKAAAEIYDYKRNLLNYEKVLFDICFKEA